MAYATSTYLAIASAVAAGAGVYQQDQARSDQKRAGKEQRAIARAQALRERKQQVRQARIARGQVVNQAYTSGGIGSTLSGAESSIGSQLGANLAFNQATLMRSERAAGFQADASKALGRANLASSIGSIGSAAQPFAKRFDAARAASRPNPLGAQRDVNAFVNTRTDLF